MRPFLVGMAGGTASGKTTLARLAATELGAALLTHDQYYRDSPNPLTHDFDIPDALDTALLCAHLDALRAGSAIDAPIYDFHRHAREAETMRVEPGGVILVEGILVLADPVLRDCFDLTVFVKADDDVRLARRIRRDTAERGRTWEDVLRQWFHSVRPAHKRWVAPCQERAQLLLDGEGESAHELTRLVAAVRAATG